MDLYGNDLEVAHWATLDRSTQKRLGQFWTPWPVARLMAAWIEPAPGPAFDPAAGSGVFARAVASRQPGRTTVCRDLDPAMIACLREVAAALPEGAVAIEEGDYFVVPADRRHGAIITNPPYLNHARIEDKERIRSIVGSETGVALSGLSNLYIYFLVRLAHQLAPGGRLAAIVPAEFLDSTYGRPVKRHLLASGLLRGVVAFETGRSIFPGAMTTAAVLLLAAGPAAIDMPVSLLRVADLDALAALEPELARPLPFPAFGRRIPRDRLDPDAAWRLLFDGEPAPPPTGFVRLDSLARLRHGITTGANGFFVRRRSELAEAGIPEALWAPTVGRSALAQPPVFTAADHARLDAEDRPVWLLRLPDAPPTDPAILALLDTPAARDAAARPSVRGRSPWWRLPERPVAPVWISNLSRGTVKVVRNASSAVSLDHFHGLEPLDPGGPAAVVLQAYAATRPFGAAVRAVAREYGDGLLKTETRELGAVPVPDPLRLPAALVERIRDADARLVAAAPPAKALAVARIEALMDEACGALAEAPGRRAA